jgi:hypothetical protein
LEDAISRNAEEKRGNTDELAARLLGQTTHGGGCGARVANPSVAVRYKGTFDGGCFGAAANHFGAAVVYTMVSLILPPIPLLSTLGRLFKL